MLRAYITVATLLLLLVACSSADDDSLPESWDFIIADVCESAVALDVAVRRDDKLMVAMNQPGTVGELNRDLLIRTIAMCQTWANEE